MGERNGGRGGPVIRFIGRIATSKLSIPMATITKRKRQDGSIVYRAEIKLRKNGRQIAGCVCARIRWHQ